MTLIPLLRHSPNELEAKASTTAITCKYGQPHNGNSGTTHTTQRCLNRHYMHLPHSYTQNAHVSIHKHTYEEEFVPFRTLLLSYRAMLHLKATMSYRWVRTNCALQITLQGTNFGPRKRRVPRRPIRPRLSSWTALARKPSVRGAPVTQNLHAVS